MEMKRRWFGLNKRDIQLNLTAISARGRCRSQGSSRNNLNPLDMVRGAADEWSAEGGTAHRAARCAANEVDGTGSAANGSRLYRPRTNRPLDSIFLFVLSVTFQKRLEDFAIAFCSRSILSDRTFHSPTGASLALES